MESHNKSATILRHIACGNDQSWEHILGLLGECLCIKWDGKWKLHKAYFGQTSLIYQKTMSLVLMMFTEHRQLFSLA